MFKIFMATTLAGSLICGSAHAGCKDTSQQFARGGASLQQTLAVAALFCTENPAKAKHAAYRIEDGRQADANFLTLLVLLRMQSLSEPNKRPQ